MMSGSPALCVMHQIDAGLAITASGARDRSGSMITIPLEVPTQSRIQLPPATTQAPESTLTPAYSDRPADPGSAQPLCTVLKASITSTPFPYWSLGVRNQTDPQLAALGEIRRGDLF